ncbi:MAG: hypothetical protein ACJA1R_002787, partial [Flavobacteriales bacterium]
FFPTTKETPMQSEACTGDSRFCRGRLLLPHPGKPSNAPTTPAARLRAIPRRIEQRTLRPEN